MATRCAETSNSEDDFSHINDDSTSEESITDEECGSDSDSDSSSDENQEGDDINVTDGLWMPIMDEDSYPQQFPLLAAAGPHHAPPPDSKPLVYAQLFLTDQLIVKMVTETNRYAEQWIGRHQHYLQAFPRSFVHYWIKSGMTTREEMYAFLAIILNMGLVKKATIKSYWDSTNRSQATPWFNERFNRDRFSLLMKFLHFADSNAAPEEHETDFKIYKVKFLLTYFNQKFRYYFKPYQNISIDESMIAFKGKTPHLRQYMPNKHHARFGVKVWCLCDSASGYLHSFEIYKGAMVAENQLGATYALVMRLMTEARLLDLGYHLGLDNYFTSPRLLFDLYRSHTTATGTVRRNRKGLPASVLKAVLGKKDVCERRKGNMLCVAYKDGTKTPILLSTHTSAGFEESRNSKGKVRRLPKCIVQYNKAMGGVDLSDARLYCYLSKRRTMKWTNKVAFSLIGRSVLNAYIIYVQNTTDRPILTRYQFTVAVVEGLIGDFRPPRKIIRKRRSKADIATALQNPTPPTAPVDPMVPGPSLCKLEKLDVGKRRNCAYKHAKRVRSSFQCPSCDVGLCPGCYAAYHQSK